MSFMCTHVRLKLHNWAKKKLGENREKGIITFTKEKLQKIDFTKSVETQ